MDINHLPAVISVVKYGRYAIDKYIPPKEAKTPLIHNAVNFVLFTLIPTDAAADGFVPTALI